MYGVIAAPLPVAWWTFWMTTAVVVFLALLLVLTRLALAADDELQAEAVGEPGASSHPAQRSEGGYL